MEFTKSQSTTLAFPEHGFWCHVFHSRVLRAPLLKLQLTMMPWWWYCCCFGEMYASAYGASYSCV